MAKVNAAIVLKVKVSGDGTKIGKRIHCVNLTVRVLYGKHRSKEHILAMVRRPEKYDDLKRMFKPILGTVPEYVKVLDRRLKIDYHLGADMKFVNEIMGLQACNSTFSCAWCKCPSTERHGHKKVWSMMDTNLGARTAEEITMMSTKKGKGNFNCAAPPLLPFIPVHNVVPDSLHLFLQISDQLINQLIQILKTKDNIKKNERVKDKQNYKNIIAFEKFVKKLSIPWIFTTNKDSGRFTYRDFTGPEHTKIQQHINLDELIPWHEKLSEIKWLWNEFSQIMKLIKEDGVDPMTVESWCRAWVDKYGSTFLRKDVTPYMHVFMNHVSESLKLHGNISDYNQQAMEKLNDTITSLFFRSTNHRNTQAFKQVMAKQNRISYLHDKWKDKLVFNVHCSMCGNTGHNKRTCFMKYWPENDV